MTSGGRHIGSASINPAMADEAQNRIADAPVEPSSMTQASLGLQASNFQSLDLDFSNLPPAPSSRIPTDLEATTVDQGTELLNDLFRNLKRILDKGTRKQYDEVLEELVSATSRARDLESQAEQGLAEMKLSKAKADQRLDQVRSETENLSTEKGMLQETVNNLKEEAKKFRADMTRHSQKQKEEKSRLDQRRDAIEQLMECWNGQNEDLKRRQIEIEEAEQVSGAMRHDLEGFRDQLKMQQIMIYADQKALHRGEKSIELERQTVVTYAKGLEEMVLKEDPAYVPPEIEDDSVRTDTIFSALVRKFDDINAQLREKVRKGDRIRLQITDLLEELGQLRRARREKQVEFETLEDENLSLREQQEADVTSQEELENTLRHAEDRHRNLIESEEKAMKRNEELKKDLKDARLERDELQKELTDVKEQKLRLDGQYTELLCETDTVKQSYRQKSEQLKTQERKRAEAQQQVSDNIRAQRAMDGLCAALQTRYDQICKEVDARKAAEITHQKALDEERTAHTGTKGAYDELDKRIGAADEETRSARRELTQLRAQHSSAQLRVEELQNKVQELAAWKEKTIDDLQNTITRLRRPRNSEHVAQRERRFMGEFATSRHDDNAEHTRSAAPLPGSSEMGLDDGRLLRPSSPRLPQAKRRRTGPKEVPRRSTNVDDGGKRLGLGVRDEDEEARRIGEFPDADKSADCVIAKLTSIRNGTDDTALPVAVKERLLEQLKYWDGRTRDWASRLQPKNAEVKCCEHVVQRKACQWHNGEEELLDCYRACPFCAKNRKVCVIVIGADKILVLPLSDMDRKTYYPGRTSFEKEDVAYWLKPLDKYIAYEVESE